MEGRREPEKQFNGPLSQLNQLSVIQKSMQVPMDKGSNIEMVASSRKPNPFAQNDQMTSGRVI